MKILKPPNTKPNKTRKVTHIVARGKSHHPVGTAKFITLDGEGINVIDGSHIDNVNCIKCNDDLTNVTRYRINEDGPYCRIDYYNEIGKPVRKRL
jgi:hypothetical protein